MGRTQLEHNRSGLGDRFGERTLHYMLFGLHTQNGVSEIYKGTPFHHNRFIGRHLYMQRYK